MKFDVINFETKLGLFAELLVTKSNRPDEQLPI
jgi:hypothetical protein